MQIKLTADSFSSLDHERGWLLGIEATTRLKDLMGKLGAGLIASALSDKRLFQEFVEQVPDHELEVDSDTLAEGLGEFLTLLPDQSLKEFLDLPEEPEAARQFLLRYGVFRVKDSSLPSGSPPFVEAFWSGALNHQQKPVALRLEDFWRIRERLKITLQIYSMVRLSDDKEDAKWVDRANALAHELNYPCPDAALTGEMFLHLRHAMVSLNFQGAHVEPVLTTHHVLPGLYALIWRRFLQKSPVGFCLRCNAVFDLDRPKKAYCSRSCQEADKQARYREHIAEAQQLHARGGKIREIAGQLGRHPKIVTRWIKQHKK